LLEVKGIDVYYGHIQALRDVSLHVDEGEMVALVGANGAGKTTTLRTISALLRPVTGTVELEGKRIDRMRPEDIVALGVSHLPEGRGMFPNLTVEENLKMGFYTKRSNRKMWKEGMERVTTLFPRLKERMHQAAGTMSGGEQQMLALSRAILPNRAFPGPCSRRGSAALRDALRYQQARNDRPAGRAVREPGAPTGASRVRAREGRREDRRKRQDPSRVERSRAGVLHGRTLMRRLPRWAR
jgi:ABC-type sugar transport system ATPase subunit